MLDTTQWLMNSKRYFLFVFCILFLVACGRVDTPNTEVSAIPTQLVTKINSAATEENPIPTPQSNESSVEIDYASAGDPYVPALGNRGYDVQAYTIQIALDPARAYEVDAHVKIDAVLTTDNLESISLDFIGFDIHAVTLGGALAEFQRSENKVFILLPENTATGDEVSIEIEYSGEAVHQSSPFVPFTSHLGLFYPDTKSLYVLSEPDGARYWIPSNDHPRDKALFRFEITVAEGYTAVANGTLQEVRINPDKTSTFIWSHKFPMAPYLATLAVGDYERIERQMANGVLLRDYVFQQNIALWQDAFAPTEEAILWLETMLGPYPFEAYGHVNVTAGGIALETQSMVVMSTYMIREEVMVHELVHQWMGDFVSLNSWGEMWRNEGFATYFEYLWQYRDTPDEFMLMMDDLQSTIEGDTTLEPLDALSPNNLFSYESYVKGAVVVHALRKEIGDEAFFAGMHIYFDRFAYRTASDADFIAVMEEASARKLDAFFEYWLEE